MYIYTSSLGHTYQIHDSENIRQSYKMVLLHNSSGEEFQQFNI